MLANHGATANATAGRIRLVALPYGVVSGLLLLALAAAGEDWPTHRHDVARSARTSEQLMVARLHQVWVHRSLQPPQPAWAGPAKWDAYAGIRGLRSMRNYDPVFHVVAVGERVYFGSSANGAVRCLDASNGAVRWSFFTDGPVRVAPTVSAGRVFFGSDDGFAYCLEAATGQLIWKFSPTAKDRQDRLILHDGRFISLWPCRTGVLVDSRTAYFGCSLLPWKESYLCAVDAATGQPQGPGHFVACQPSATLEGVLLASAKHLWAPQGRIAPQLFDRSTGKALGSLEGGGGCFVLLTDDEHILHGPGNKTGWITDSNAHSRAKVASYPRGNTMVVAGNSAYLLTDRALSAIDRSSGRVRWRRLNQYPYELILAGDLLLAGGTDTVAGFRASDGELLWHAPVEGRAYGLAVANGALFVSTDEGAIHCFRAQQPTDPAASATQQPIRPATAEKPGSPRAPKPSVAAIATIKDPHLRGRWVFQSDQVDGSFLHDLAGSLDVRLEGEIAFRRPGGLQALEMNGETTDLILADDSSTIDLPKREITAEAWVRIDEPLQWGGILGAFQDNGLYERGWLLGYCQQQFCFAVAAEKGPGRLTYLRAREPFNLRQWYHVAGVYDGSHLHVYINGQEQAVSSAQQGAIAYPPKAPYVIGAYRDKNEHFRMTGMIQEVRLYDRALSAHEVEQHYRAKPLPKAVPAKEPVPTLTLALRPYLQFVDTDRAIVRWRSRQKTSTILEYQGRGLQRRIYDPSLKTAHQVMLDGLRKNTLYRYMIKESRADGEVTSKPFECDTFFNYCAPRVSGRPRPFAEKEKATQSPPAAKAILTRSGANDGVCLVLGIGSGEMAYELAAQSNLRVIGVDTDPARVKQARKTLDRVGVYGIRVVFRHVESLKELPFTGDFANLLVLAASVPEARVASTAAEVARVLRPAGGIACLLGSAETAPDSSTRQLADRLRMAGLEVAVTDQAQHVHVTARRGPLENVGVWSHLYGLPDNAAFGGEALAGARSSGDLQVQWLGRPGPRAQADRNGRKPSPLATGNRLFTQGLDRIVALDIYNGLVLWSLEIPDLRRFNMPRDCGNWCADEGFVYLAMGPQCWQIDAANGSLANVFDVRPDARKQWQYDWGYVARHRDMLLGSAVKQGTSHRQFWGGAGAGWYDSKAGPVTFKICSENLFSKDRRDGKLRWEYRSGVLINPTLTIGEDRVYFVECRHPKVFAATSRRVGLPELWKDQYLVALDAYTGKKLWEQAIDTADGVVTFYLAYGSGKLIIGSSDDEYHVDAFDAETGRALWTTSFPWPEDNHGKHMQRPAIVGNRVFVRPRALDLQTGELLEQRMPVGGCGTYAATRDALFFRNRTLVAWDVVSGKTTGWSRLRPDCWLSTIPAGGMLLSPEGGGGCSCGSWMETSIGFVPRNRSPGGYRHRSSR